MATKFCSRLSAIIVLAALLVVILPVASAFAATGSKYYVSVNGGAWTPVSSSYSVPANAAASTTARTVAAKIVHYDNADVVWTFQQTIRWTWNSTRVYTSTRTAAATTPMPFWTYYGLNSNVSQYQSSNTVWYSYMGAHFGANIFGIIYNEYPTIGMSAKRYGGCAISMYGPSI